VTTADVVTLGPGDAFQFDWNEHLAVINGKRVKLQATHTKLAHSRAFMVRAYRLQTTLVPLTL